jgi:hypothetical protein
MAVTLAASAGQQLVGEGAGLSSALAPRGENKKVTFSLLLIEAGES